MFLIVYLFSINLLGFCLMGIDKVKSINGWYRIKENTLILVGVIGGCFGLGIGMNIFRHKTRKLKFKMVYCFCLVYIVLFWYVLVGLANG